MKAFLERVEDLSQAFDEFGEKLKDLLGEKKELKSSGEHETVVPRPSSSIP